MTQFWIVNAILDIDAILEIDNAILEIDNC